MLLSATAVGTVSELLDARRLLPRPARDDLPRDARPLGEGRAGRRDHALRRARRARRARGSRRPREDRRAGRPRPGGLERRALRPHRQGDGDAARPRPGGPVDRAARPGAARRDRRPRRPRRADRLRPRPAARDERLRAHRDAAQGELRADHAPLRGRSGDHRRPDRLPGARQAHLRLPAGQPRHPRRATIDGEVGARPLRRGQPRRPQRTCRWRCSRSRCRRPR